MRGSEVNNVEVFQWYRHLGWEVDLVLLAAGDQQSAD